MKIVFFGDSITDMSRARDRDYKATGYGVGFVNSIAGTLKYENPTKYDIVNRGIAGNRTTDLYARIKADVWNQNPDVLNILIGVNDVWDEIYYNNGISFERFEKIYRMIIEETKERFPDIKMILCEPFTLTDFATKEITAVYYEVKRYAALVKRLAQEYGCGFVALQDEFEKAAAKFGTEHYLYDGVHPDIAGARLIAEEWLKVFRREIEGRM